MFVGLFILITAIKNTSLIIRDRHRIVQQESKYQRDETTQKLKMRGEVVFDNLICQYLEFDDYRNLCVEYLKTKVDVWFSALRSIDELIFSKRWNHHKITTQEELQKCKDDELTSNRIEFDKAFDALLDTNLFDLVKNKDKTIENFIKVYDALMINNMENAWESQQMLKTCLAECVRLQMLLDMIVYFFETSKKGSFGDAAKIEFKLSKIFSILKNTKTKFLHQGDL